MHWLFVLVVGGGLGVVAAVSEAAGSGPSPTMRALSIVFSLGMIWAAAAFFGGVLLAKAPWSALGGPLVLLAAALGYVAWGVASGKGTALIYHHLTGRTQLLLVAGALMAPLLGLLGGVARTGNLAGILARLVVPIGLSTEIVVRYPLHSAEFTADPVRAWTSAGVLIAGVLGATFAMVNGQSSSQ
ncbi:MAG: hypothetical protein M3Y66_00625 [Actinomycetota bacterium]|nr:hypothetical protein [Actinomycetota bacterium]